MKQDGVVLIVDDEAQMRRILARMLAERGFRVTQADTGEKGVALAADLRPDVVVMDQNLPGISGQEATEQIVEMVPGVKVIMVTAFGEIERAVDAMRRGAFDYLTKPFDNDELLLRVERAWEVRRLATEVESLREALGERYGFGRILGQSDSLLAAIRQGERAAQTDVSILVEGESGTGKELLVQAIHHASSRQARRLVAVNCAAVPAAMAESQFFGHERGAFTDARSSHAGWFEQAHGGTLFLDEISEMPTGLQTKLLRSLEEGEITRVGGELPIPVDVRLIAATNISADKAVSSGRLREDLYHRLTVITIRLPALRNRTGDIPLVAQHFLSAFARENQNSPRTLSEDALAAMENYSWPGNVRELRNAVQGAAIMSDGDTIRLCHLPRRIRETGAPGIGESASGPGVDDGPLLAAALEDVERRMINDVLRQESGNRTRAAARLGINRKTLISKIARYGL